MIIELGGSQMQSVQLFSAIYASNIQERAVASANKRHIMAVTSTEAASRPSKRTNL